MKRVWLAVAIAAAAVVVVGCTPSEKHYQGLRQRLIDDPDLKRRVIDYCIDDLNRKRRQDRETVAAIMKVPLTRVGADFCRRAINGIVSGRIPYEEFEAALKGEGDVSRLVAVLQGR